jgi:predicted small metal-binding protein
MAKELRCGDIMPGCQKVIEGKDDQEVLAKAAAHARDDHNLPSIPPEVAQKVQQAIRTK